MADEEQAKAGEAPAKALIQVQTGDIEVAKLQLAARWAEMTSATTKMDAFLNAFNQAYKAIDETLRL